jgi:hypothetical protein
MRASGGIRRFSGFVAIAANLAWFATALGYPRKMIAFAPILGHPGNVGSRESWFLSLTQGIEDMRHKLRLGFFALLAIVVLSSTATVQAADSKGHFASMGIGGQSCKIVMDQMQKDSKEAVITASWLLGYLTAVNREQPDTFDISPVFAPGDLLNAVAGICQTHPDMPVENVFNGLLRVLSIARNRADSPIIETRSGKNTASLRTETWIAMQSKLVSYGYLKGKPEGSFGSKSEMALKAFQKDQKLPETGVADGATIIRLLIELPGKKN